MNFYDFCLSHDYFLLFFFFFFGFARIVWLRVVFDQLCIFFFLFVLNSLLFFFLRKTFDIILPSVTANTILHTRLIICTIFNVPIFSFPFDYLFGSTSDSIANSSGDTFENEQMRLDLNQIFKEKTELNLLVAQLKTKLTKQSDDFESSFRKEKERFAHLKAQFDEVSSQLTLTQKLLGQEQL